MRQWPDSLPDYAWPESLGSTAMVVARIAMAIVFYVAHLLGRCVSFFDRKMDRVLIIRTDGLGDAVLFEPALRAIARTMSSRRFHLWAPQLTCDLLAQCPLLHRITVIPRGYKNGNLTYFVSLRWRTKLGFMLGRWKFDKVIYPAYSPEPFGNWLLASARTYERWVTIGDTINQFDWQRSRAHEGATRVLQRLSEESIESFSHELLQNRHLALQCNADAQAVDLQPLVYLSDTARDEAQSRFGAWRKQAEKLGAKELIAVIPAASMKLNSYPNAAWAEALNQLWRKRRTMPVILGGPDDGAAIHELARELSRQHVPWLTMDAQIGILEMSAIIAEFDAIFSVDTGLAHLAVAQQVPTIVLVGGGNPGRFFPWPEAPHHVALNIPMPCDGCNNRCMFREAACITLITPQQIVAAYTRLKRKGRQEPLKLLPVVQKSLRAAG